MTKLIGIKNTPLKMFSCIKQILCYLLDRKQFVKSRAHRSVEYFEKSGLPNGSYLGPFLFNMFINIIIDVKYISNVIVLYADNIKIFHTICVVNDCQLLQENLTKVNEWCMFNNLLPNVLKCCIM